ncbi:MAG: DUF2125 domain-containing protein [Pseudomonadota bacterium]
MKRVMVWAVGLVVVAALGWGLWWQALASGQRAAIEAWFADRRQAGWQAELGAITVEGFPLRLDRELLAIQLADPRAGWSWTLPRVGVKGEAIAPTRFDLVMPDHHSIAIPGQRVDIRHRRLDGQLSLVPGPRLGWRDGIVQGEAVAIASQAGWEAGAEALSAQLVERAPGTAPANSYTMTLDATGVDLPRRLLDRIDPADLLSTRVEELSFAGSAALTAPLDLRTIENGEIDLTAATIRKARLSWGELAVDARGTFDVTADGYPQGEITLTLSNWRQMIVIARNSGAVEPGLIDAAEQALQFVALIAGDGDNIDVPLKLSCGKVRIGPFAIADAPRLAEAGK